MVVTSGAVGCMLVKFIKKGILGERGVGGMGEGNSVCFWQY